MASEKQPWEVNPETAPDVPGQNANPTNNPPTHCFHKVPLTTVCKDCEASYEPEEES